MRPVIKVENLSKAYRLGQIGAGSLKEDISNWWRRMRTGEQKPTGNFWALRDISFEVREGEVLGIIGANGAGKSTLLKILSRITEPTSGRATVRGRLSSLLEVGTGFHPDLTGRENVYLNGAIMGLTRTDVRKRFDEIVAFSGIERFIDTPVKRYSSGMNVRLGFAVAAHLEPDLLIVDEVLAVGDAEFQRKCMGKMQEVSRGQGRTILFVSHNMHSIERLCSRGIVLVNGAIHCMKDGVTDAILAYHQLTNQNHLTASWTNPNENFNNPWFNPARMFLARSDGSATGPTVTGKDEVWICIEGEHIDPDLSVQIGYGLVDPSGDLLYWTTNRDVPEEQWVSPKTGLTGWRSRLPLELLNEGDYRVDLFLGYFHRKWISEPGKTTASIRFELKGGLSKSPLWRSRRPGTLAPVMKWDCIQPPPSASTR